MTNLEMMILGSGTSSQIPVISCLISKEKSCACCLSTTTSIGQKNIRRNTSAILKIKSSNRQSTSKTILIDVGKSFCDAARQFFPINHLSIIDAVLLTHPHADAINGLDDLRAWTLDAVIQPSIPIYCDQFTFSEVERMFPYMVNSANATGGGDVPAFQWNIIQDGQPFDLFGVRVLPLKVHHGCYFGPTGDVEGPYGCLAFLFDRSICYMSDVSSIPDSTYAALGVLPPPTSAASSPTPTHLLPNLTLEGSDTESDLTRSTSPVSTPATSLESELLPIGLPPLPILVIDTLRLKPHTSHFGLAEAVATADRLGAQRTYLLGFTHGVTHECWQKACEAIGEGRRPNPTSFSSLSSNQDTDDEIELGNHPERFTQEALKLIEKSNPIWVRPSFDGLWIKTDGKTSSDDFY
ncbi:beta-lactamase-like protein [Melampsora americana]|nr:beta-lactamase-like protein [Melampsora americana]